MYNYFINQPEIPVISLKSIIPAAIRNSLKANIITDALQVCINALLKNLGGYIANKENLSNIFYALAILDHYRIKYNEFKLTISEDLIKSTISYSIKEMADKNLSKRERQQYFFSALYFCNFYSNLIDNSLEFDLKSQADDISKLGDTVKDTTLQNNVGNYLRVFFPKIKSEIQINTFRADFLFKNHIIEVHGPDHFIWVDAEKHELSASDLLRETLLNCTLMNDFNKMQEKAKYKISTIDYLIYNQTGNSYVKSLLAEKGLSLRNQHKTDPKGVKKSFYKNEMPDNVNEYLPPKNTFG